MRGAAHAEPLAVEYADNGQDEPELQSRADITTKRPEKKRHGLRQISELAERISALQAEDAVVPPLPSGIGDEVMRAFGLAPSRRIGELKKALEQSVEAGEVASHQTADVYIAFLRDHRERFGL